MPTDKPLETEELSFEEALDRLEKIVEKLETGDVPLETSIHLFQEGMSLSRMCSKKLETVEQKIRMLMNDQDEWTDIPVEED